MITPNIVLPKAKRRESVRLLLDYLALRMTTPSDESTPSGELFNSPFYHLQGGVTGLNPVIATRYFEVLRDSVDWVDGVRSRFRGFTRLAKPIVEASELTTIGEGAIAALFSAALSCLIETGCMHAASVESVMLRGVYLNYYRDGEMYTPAHRHPDTTQIIISLGGERTLTVNSKSHRVQNGDIVVLKNQLHGVPKEAGAEPRISVVAFVDKA